MALGGFFLLLAALVWPALQHHVAALTGNPAIAAIEDGRALTETGLLRTFTSRREALGALEHNRARRELGQVHLRHARDPDVDSLVRHDEVAAAKEALGAALDWAPADHFAWYHLAMAEALGERAETATRALDNAYGFGPYHPPIRAARSRLGVALWADLEPPGSRRSEPSLGTERSSEKFPRHSMSVAVSRWETLPARRCKWSELLGWAS